MDPNMTLHEIRLIMLDIQRNCDEGKDTSREKLSRLVDLFNGLDNWIIMEGELPNNWDYSTK